MWVADKFVQSGTRRHHGSYQLEWSQLLSGSKNIAGAVRAQPYLLRQPVDKQSKYAVMKFYRLGAHAFLLCSLWLISIQNNNLLFDLLVVLMGYFLLTYFIDLHADAAEALTVTFLMEESMSHQRGLEAIQRAPGGLVADVMASSKYRGF